ncbi:MAG: hypothetical protein KZQ64_12715 [gamma proteobacterium symbiont of Bathyaustriella thionipta]|nr:hypothetical protein [gamma proteobacterium symbiont of Bathyaustriella thionipta]MCU7950031.1 hypothetical protein [gamma proteobacterium symbiont of Bathyaustriella thionipta]MCU7954233.1 hypothetical protein [gamma proteobacterium symbiont of Bathyaustriella thionipta]MCU7956620.1 hypothetical protein [gamma proteobacterium symbiont of Bathyaustriella thionipta]MCU7967738.1 hypothetical protein [gamma proteobacterium symbiont of Bathyaustriella thionipta]
MKKILLAVLMLVSSFAQAGERLTSDELKAFYTDKTLRGIHHKLGPGSSYWGADGGVRSLSEQGKERVGKWWIDESQAKRCLRWSHKKKNFCHYTERNDDGTHTLVHGKNGKKLVEIKSSEPGN